MEPKAPLASAQSAPLLLDARPPPALGMNVRTCACARVFARVSPVTVAVYFHCVCDVVCVCLRPGTALPPVALAPCAHA